MIVAPISHAEATRLAVCFRAVSDSRSEQDKRIIDWLEKLIDNCWINGYRDGGGAADAIGKRVLLAPTPARLNLGCCDRHMDGYLNVDVCPPADVIADLGRDWPWPDSSVDEVLAYDVFEHLPDKRHTMNELWRVLKPGGIARLQIPHATDGDGGHCDPTHSSYWTTSDFEYYHPGIAERERFRKSEYYGVKADFKIANLTPDGKIPTQRFERSFGGYVVEMRPILEAVK